MFRLKHSDTHQFTAARYGSAAYCDKPIAKVLTEDMCIKMSDMEASCSQLSGQSTPSKPPKRLSDMISLLLALASVIVSIGAKVTYSGAMNVHETRSALPFGFTDAGSADDNTVVTLRAALVQNNIFGLEEALYAVSVPGSPRYGQHLSKAQVSPLPRFPFAVCDLIVCFEGRGVRQADVQDRSRRQ